MRGSVETIRNSVHSHVDKSVETMRKKEAVCPVCFRHCHLAEGETGFCRARTSRSGEVKCNNYGKLTSIALDPVEKKPLARFYPGSYVLSIGSYGCSYACPFCQNSEISMAGEGGIPTRYVSPEDLVALADRLRPQGNIGLAFTYNEATVGWEYVRDAARLAREAGMKNILVTNGNCCLPVLEEFLPFIDAMNIDLKSFDPEVYREVLNDDLSTVLDFISATCDSSCHVELTKLIVPGVNDSEEDMRRMCRWIAGLRGRSGSEIPLHVSRFFPAYHMIDRGPTPVDTVYHLADLAREYLKYVYTGNC